MSQSNHTIMSFGTFGLWGSLLASEDGKVVFPAGKYAKVIPMREMILTNVSNWIGLDT
jgi:hypothetical protein